ncbi:MAG: RES family NAD+ phosphorylase, partial [Acidobacteriota bacterium]|nr:RES family NAD+ phosphorylase [Acidobacteriota bacterium]
RRPYSRTPFDGEGAYRYGGRWSSIGTRIAYASEHLSLAMLEYFVHLDPNDPPKDLVLVAAEIPSSVPKIPIDPKRLPKTWRQTPAHPELATIGDDFIRHGRTTILTVPSALAPTESNWLLNPLHTGFSKIRVHPAEPFEYDPRFFA